MCHFLCKQFGFLHNYPEHVPIKDFDQENSL